MAETLLTPEQAAHHLGTNKRTLETWRRVGTGRAYLKLGRRMVRYSMAAIEAFLEGCASASTQGGQPE